MAKKRKASARSSEPQGFEPKGGKLGPITTYEDVADSEDEFHINRDKVLLDEGPDAKRRRKFAEEDALHEPSDEEVLGYSSDSSDEDGAPQNANSESDDGEEEEGEEEEEGWGTSRKDYYNADEIQTEADALDEEAEAKRIQQRKLQKMTDADFGFDESEWLAPATTIPDEEGDDVMIEVLKDVEITEDMGPEERLRVLRTRYPEFEMLANEFVALQPILVSLQQDEQSSVTIVKTRALAAYIASLSMYFALLTSPTSPADLRDHPVMDSLFSCRSLWTKVSSLIAPTPESEAQEEADSDSEPEEETTTKQSTLPPAIQTHKSTTKQLAKAKAASQAATLRAQKIATADLSLADLDSLLPSRTKAKKTVFKDTTDDTNDFGESSHMTAAEAASKATRKKSLKFYTSQIAQKANKRTAGGREAGGDADLPYKERLRDRVARLNAEATKRGKKLDAYGRGADLGGDSGDDDEAGNAGEREVAREVRQDGEDEYYDLVNATSKAKREQKATLISAAQAAHDQNAILRVEEGVLDEDGKRAIGYVIEKNKGLAPKRKKDVRNPRVKKRKKYEEKKKKLGSMKAVYKGGEERV
ncbi:Uncharacterized protein LOCC1_G008623, partial [Lachnellula occidentalis]